MPMAAARPPARRITPERLGDGQASQDAAQLIGDASNDALQSPSQPARQLDLREQAAIAKQKLGSGRRIFVDLQKDGNVVDWHKLLKAAGSGEVPTSPAAALGVPPAVPGNLFKEPARPKNAFSSVIQRLEQAYVMNDGEESSSSEPASEGAADSGQSAEVEGEEKRGGESGRESGREGAAGAAKPKKASAAGGAPKDDQYDYDDGFIDDSEFIEYYGGDRRRAKHSGFFVNCGEIEKTGELIDKQEASPKRRRKKSAPAAEDGKEGGPPPAKRAKPARQSQAPPALAAPAPAFAHEVIPETQDGFQHQPASALPAHIAASAEASAGGISAQPPAAAPASAQKKKAAAGGAAGDKPYCPSKDAAAGVEALRKLAAAETAPPEGATKKIPESLRSMLSEEFIGPYIRDLNKHKDAQATLVGRLMEFMEPFTTRGNLMRLLSQGKTKVTTDYDVAKAVLRECIRSGCQAAEAKAGVQGPAARSRFVWTSELLSTMVQFVHLRGLVKGRLMIDNGKIWGQIADLFDNHLMDAASVEKAYRVAIASGVPGTVAPPPAAAPTLVVTPQAIPAPAAPAQLPAVTPASAPAQVATIVRQAAAPSPAVPAISPAAGAVPVAAAVAPTQPPTASAAEPAVPLMLPPLRTGSSAAPQLPQQHLPAARSPNGQGSGQFSNPPTAVPGAEGSNAAAAAQDVDPQPHIAAGASLGGNAEQLAASVRAFSKGTMKFLVNLTLMHAGAKGFRIGEIVEQAAAAGIADWREKGKRNYLSTVVTKEPSFVNVGAYHYALRAFPGVAEAGASVESAKAAALAAQARSTPAAAVASLPSASSLAQPALVPSPLQLLGQQLLSGSLPPVSNAAPQPPQSDTNFGGS